MHDHPLALTMSLELPSRPRSALALGLSLVLVLAAGLGPALLASSLAQTEDRQAAGDDAQQTNGSSEETNDRGNQTNGTANDTHRSEGGSDHNGNETNRSQDQDNDRSRQDARGADQDESPREDGTGRQGRADPVEIQRIPGGFATRAPPESPRPEVVVDADRGRALVQRPGVQPLSMTLDTLVEFTDADGDGGYDVGEPVIQRHPLRSTPYRIAVDPANETRTVVYDLANGSQLQLVFDLGTSHGERVGTKLDVEVEGYVFENASTRIALGTRVHVDGGLEHATQRGRPVLLGERGEEVAYLSWRPTVQVDGEQAAVTSTVHVDAVEPTESAIVYWAYPQGEHIVHDPTLGVRDAIQDLAGRAMPFAIGLAATVGLLGVGYAVRSRWRL